MGNRCMWIHISGRRIDDVRTFCTGIVTSWAGWRARQRWRRLWSWLSASVGWRCTCAFASPACLRIVAVAIVARKASGCVVLTKRSLVSLYCSLYFLCPSSSTPCFFSARTLVRGFLIRYCISSIVPCQNLSLAILAIFKARHMSDCSSCTWPPCLAIVADMVKT